MQIKKVKQIILPIIEELKNHVLFTAFGALTGVIIMWVILYLNIPRGISHTSFYTLHPLHIVFSALVTTAMYKLHTHGKIWTAMLIGYTGSIGVATLSDVIIPYIGAYLLGMHIPFIVPFIVKWWINPLALIGILIGYYRPITKFPHTGHVLLSTWASLFNITQHQIQMAGWMLPFIFLFLFLAVWVPCCTSDIVYPLLFIKKERDLTPEK